MRRGRRVGPIDRQHKVRLGLRPRVHQMLALALEGRRELLDGLAGRVVLRRRVRGVRAGRLLVVRARRRELPFEPRDARVAALGRRRARLPRVREVVRLVVALAAQGRGLGLEHVDAPQGVVQVRLGVFPGLLGRGQLALDGLALLDLALEVVDLVRRLRRLRRSRELPQDLGAGAVAGIGRVVGGRPAAVVLGGRVGAPHHELAAEPLVARRREVVQRPRAVVELWNIRVGAVVEELLDEPFGEGRLRRAARVHEGRAARVRRGVDVRAPLQQGLDEVLVAVLRADDQRRRALVVHGPQVVLERRRHRPIDDGVRRGVALPIKGQ